MVDRRIEEIIKRSELSKAAQADVRASIESSPYLHAVMLSGIEDNRIRKFALTNDPNEGGHYDRQTGSISIRSSYFEIENLTVRLDALTGVLGHEAGHALMARSAEITVHLYAYEVVEGIREASRNGDAGVDITSSARRAVNDFRANEGLAELVSMNSMASRIAKTQGSFDRTEFLKRADWVTECIDNGKLDAGIRLDANGIQLTGNTIKSAAVERVAQCQFDNGAKSLGSKGTSGYDDYYAAYMVSVAADAWKDYARSTTRPMPSIELDLAALKSSGQRVEDAGVVLDGPGQSFNFVDLTSGERRQVSVRQIGGSDASPTPSQAPTPNALLADNPHHPDHGTFNRIHEWVHGTGQWSDEQSRNVASALFRQQAESPLVQRVDRVVGGIGQDGAHNVFAVYAPHGDKGPFFRAQVDGREAMHQPAQQSLEQAEVITQQRQQQQTVEQQVQQPARTAPSLTM